MGAEEAALIDGGRAEILYDFGLRGTAPQFGIRTAREDLLGIPSYI